MCTLWVACWSFTKINLRSLCMSPLESTWQEQPELISNSVL